MPTSPGRASEFAGAALLAIATDGGALEVEAASGGVGAVAERTVVMGRNLGDRVIPYAEKIAIGRGLLELRTGSSAVIRLRRAKNAKVVLPRYELELQLASEPASDWFRRVMSRAEAVRRLEPVLGVGDAWSFVQAADAAWKRDESSWAVEFEERGR